VAGVEGQQFFPNTKLLVLVKYVAHKDRHPAAGHRQLQSSFFNTETNEKKPVAQAQQAYNILIKKKFDLLRNTF
jgi:hypothetical protein